MPTSPQRINEILAAKGLNPEDVRQKIQQHVQNVFGSPQGYAQAIMSKPQEQLSDPQTAEAFRAIAPALFGEGAKPLGYDPNRPGVMSFNFGQTAPVPAGANMHPSARAALDAIGQYQQANPLTIPVAPGTKPRWQLQDEETMRAQAARESLEQEKWDWQREQTEREFAYRQQQDAIANALAQLKASAGSGSGAGGVMGMYNQLGTQTERQNMATANYQRIVQNAIAEGNSLDKIAKDIVDASADMQADGVNPADLLRFAVGHFEQQYGGQKWQPGQDVDIKWFQNYKWYLDNKDELMTKAEDLERQFKPALPAAPVAGAEYLTPEERQRIAEILGIPLEDVDLYIKTNPALISQLLGRKYGDMDLGEYTP